jgi:2'-5' RNA ligase
MEKPAPVLLALILVLTLSAAGQGTAGLAMMDRPPAAEAMDMGSLFSAFLFGETPLGRRWAALRPEAEKLFPALKMKAVADLHMTVVYVGRDWRTEDLDRLRQAMALQLGAPVRLHPEIATFGRNGQVIAVELKGIPESLQAQIVAMKAQLNAAGLKKPEAYDASFRAHVTLAEAKENPPTAAQRSELQAFAEWIVPRLDLSSLQVSLEPAMPVLLLLAGATRPNPVPEYITVDGFLKSRR